MWNICLLITDVLRKDVVIKMYENLYKLLYKVEQITETNNFFLNSFFKNEKKS